MRRLLGLMLLISVILARGAQAQPLAPSSAEAFDAASRRVVASAEAVMQLEGASPAIALVMVRRGQAPTIWVRGPLDARGAAQANADTPFYIASQTKAFTGLMALILHERGVFSIDQSLADIWPDLRLPEGADPGAITFRMLLSHQGVIENEPLSVRTTDTDFVPAADYPRLLANFSTVREPGFLYSNVGYLIYSAALETRTGRDWRYWIESTILRPAGFARTSARTSRFNMAELPRYHQWLGGDDWVVHEGKPDATMHAAGGLVASPNDMARWLALQLGDIPGIAAPDVLAESQRMQIAADIEEAGQTCQGYAVGWNLCRIGDVDVRLHGGGFTGVRSVTAFSPELGVGFAFMSNSDSLTGALSRHLAQVFFETIQDPSWSTASPEGFATEFGSRLRRFLEGRRRAVAGRRAEAQWQGWVWRPSGSELRRYSGRYRNPAYGDMVVGYRGGALQARLGVLRVRLEPATPDRFGWALSEIEPPEPFQFHRSDNGASSLTWRGERFERVR